MSSEELKALAEEIAGRLTPIHKDVLSIDEAAAYMDMPKTTLYKLTSGREIPHFKPKAKTIFFRRADLDEWMLRNPVATNEELNAEAMAMAERLRNPRKGPISRRNYF